MRDDRKGILNKCFFRLKDHTRKSEPLPPADDDDGFAAAGVGAGCEVLYREAGDGPFRK